MNWDHLRTFLFVARHRSLAAAAGQLGVSPRTVARQLAVLEQHRGSRLFHRMPSGFVLTRAGERALAHVQEMEKQALAAVPATARQDIPRDNLVTKAAADILVAQFVAIVRPSVKEHPEISISDCGPPGLPRIARRDADVVIRSGEWNEVDQEIVATPSPGRRGILE